MKILLVHNFYGITSGENIAVERDFEALVSAGVDTRIFSKDNKVLLQSSIADKIRAGIKAPWSRDIQHEFEKVCRDFKPSLIHVHNTFPQITNAIFYSEPSIPKIFTLHNYRSICASGTLVSAGKPCSLCVKRSRLLTPILKGCYRDSPIQSVPAVMNTLIHRNLGTLNNKADAIIALSKHQKDLFVQAGLREDKIKIKPHFIEQTMEPLASNRKNGVIFVGRLSSEKGIETLLASWDSWGAKAPKLKIVGSGPLETDLRHRYRSNTRIKFYGQLCNEITLKKISESQLLVLPSRWPEPFGLVLIEAIASGTPIAVSNIGTPMEIAQKSKGIIFNADDPVDLQIKIKKVFEAPKLLHAMEKSAILAAKKYFSKESHINQINKIYEHVINERALKELRNTNISNTK